MAILTSDAAYGELLREVKSCVRLARLRPARAINRAQLALCWDRGRLITERRREMNQEERQ